MLNPDRAKYVTASQAHSMMGGWESELNPVAPPDIPMLVPLLELMKHGKPRVIDAKAHEFIVTGAQINVAWKYYQSIQPHYTEGMESLSQQIAMKQIILSNGFELEGFGGNRHTERGNNTELEAVQALEKKTGVQFDFTGDDQNFFSTGFIGATPDGVLSEGFDIAATVEVKCPDDHIHMKNIVGHWKGGELAKLNDQDDLLRIYPEYYWQCMTALAVTDAYICHFATFNPKFGDNSLVYIPVLPERDKIGLIKSRAETVINRATDILGSLT